MLAKLPDELLLDLILPAAIGPARQERGYQQRRDVFLPGLSQANRSCRALCIEAAGRYVRRTTLLQEQRAQGRWLGAETIEPPQNNYAIHQGKLAAATNFLTAACPPPEAAWCARGSLDTTDTPAARQVAARAASAVARHNWQRLHLDAKGLTSLPPSTAQCINVRRVSASFNLLKVMPQELHRLECIETLRLHCNELKSPLLLPSLSSHALRTLDLSRNCLTEVPVNIAECVCLADLNVAHNRLTSLPDQLYANGRLRRLSLAHNHLTSLGDSLAAATRLVSLNIGSNPLSSLPNAIGALASLECLRAEACGLSELPASIDGLRSLKECWLDFNYLKEVRFSMPAHANLRLLSLSFNEVRTMPVRLGVLPRLETLLLQSNPIRTLPNLQFSFPALRSLDVQHSKLTRLPNVGTVYRSLVVNALKTPAARKKRWQHKARALQSHRPLPLDRADRRRLSHPPHATVLY